ncbi:hypothetical protein DIU31_007190 [Mucilaginibacter rubeus]|uniref:Uncharacterized protein n=1 Tax=Mucilaginibacter rubeus TaxID=2027860 RepID=A0AAE6JEH3_9SPHI|nr:MULTISPECIES: hypothetical protein [Mucilaginibacter]QEM03317.1 hypothetical protein DIU31_007190 [Mucilaginibacter rubeus]QEM15935.1 hypothetical protein DIU38_007270 [Mucilaginibacter gossypii]QTE41321.1 hypothetical protein J3L19_20485 [Mucilaginibacter rubeus]QTE47925.1 hypothetical protein J3L21_20470 [Mucilaginibacter rubeus]QTE59318.1 hypothetical protein J3L23_12140 [Mucilaginibacter rubeus]
MMGKKYKFRKAYFIAKDNQIFEQFEMVNCYRRKEYVDSVCKSQQRLANDESSQMWNKGKPIPVLKAHGYYLVHESLYEEIIKPFEK